jgi:hypothetical protein
MPEDKKKNIDILIKAVVVSQSKGSFSLKDASLIHAAVVSLVGEEKKIEEKDALSVLVQGVAIGQKSGAFSLDEASVIFPAVKWIEENNGKSLEPIKEEQEEKIKEI